MKFIDEVKAISEEIDHPARARKFFEEEVKPLILCRAKRGFSNIYLDLPGSDAPEKISYSLVKEILVAEGFFAEERSYLANDGIRLEIYW